MNIQLAKTIGQVARAARQAAGLTQEDAAEEIGISFEFYGRIERGRAQPSLATLLVIAEVFELKTDELLGLKKPSLRRKQKKSDEPSDTRRLVRSLGVASPRARRLIQHLLDELQAAEKSGSKC